MNQLETLLEQYEPFLKKLSKSPLKSFKGQKEAFLKLSKTESVELYQDLVVQFIEFYQGYDEQKGVPLEAYLITKLGWFAHHKGERLLEDKKHLIDGYHMDELEQPERVEEQEQELNEELSFAMEKGIEQLPKRQKQVFTLHFLEGLEISEIAKQLNLHPDVCFRHRTLALRNLRKNLPTD